MSFCDTLITSMTSIKLIKCIKKANYKLPHSFIAHFYTSSLLLFSLVSTLQPVIKPNEAINCACGAYE